MRIYDHLFFDLDNTLWDFTTNSRLAMHETLVQTKLLSQLPDFDIFFNEYEKINSALWNKYHTKQITKQKLISERFCLSFNVFGLDNLNWGDINSLYLENMALQNHLFQDTIETLEALKTKGYLMHIITNGFKEVQYKKIENCRLTPFFTKIFISEETQSIKPHREIFEYALKSTNAKKKKSIMIGDSWDTDIMGAINFGIDQVMFSRDLQKLESYALNEQKMTAYPRFLSQKKGTKTYFIENFKEILQIL
jgi:HAD superfamily (subfamily IA) hydrolase, TIGR02254